MIGVVQFLVVDELELVVVFLQHAFGFVVVFHKLHNLSLKLPLDHLLFSLQTF